MPIPNRWTTPITVEIFPVDRESTYKNFSDLQLAYLWIQEQSLEFPNEWNLLTFEETCRELDIAYTRAGLRGYSCVAQNSSIQYIVYYGVLTI